MKKLLSILTISTLTASVPTPLLANAPLTRVKRDVSILTSNSNNDYVPIKNINGIDKKTKKIAVDSKDNIYFGMAHTNVFKLATGTTTPTKIDGISGSIYSITVDNKDSVYFAARYGLFVLKQGYTTPVKISITTDIIAAIGFDNKNNLYFGTPLDLFVLKQGSTTPTKIDGISDYVYSLAVDNNDNIYFGTIAGAYKLIAGSDTATKIDGINSAISLTSDSLNNIYFGTDNGAFVLKQGSTTPTKIDGISDYVYSLAVDNNDNIYFGTDNGAFVLKQGSTTPTKIDGISDYVYSLAVDNNDNIYFGTIAGAYIMQTALSWIKQQSQFALVDSSKTQTWTRSDLIAVDGELNIDITNPNIDKVVFDNVEQPQTSKQWKINVKPETAAKDHNLQVMFTLDGKQYTSEIIVSMQAKIDPPTPIIKENLSDVVKFGDENNLGNIVDNNDSTIETKIQQLNSRIVDFSQIEITKKYNHSATLTAKSDSKSYAGSVDVTYNVVPTTVVDLKIDVTPTSSLATVVKDYLGQIDIINITNPVNTFYYVSSESIITMVKPTDSSVIAGVVYGCDDKWNKTSQSSTIDPTRGIKLDGSQLATNDGKYVVELSDNLGHTNNVYLQIGPKQKISNYFDTDNGKQFEIWAKANGYDNIRGYGVTQLNKLFEESENWQQLASDSQFAIAVAEWFKNNAKLSSTEPLTAEQVIEQLKKQIPSSIKIPAINTSNYDPSKVSFELNQSEFKPNDKVNITIKYNNTQSEQFTLQIKDSNTPDNKKGGDSKLWIIGVVIGVLAGLGIAYLLFKRFVFDKYIYPKIKVRGHKKFVERVRKKEQAAEQEQQEKVASEQAQENRERDDEDNNNNKGGNE